MNLKPLDIILLEGVKGNVPDEIIMHWSNSAFTHCVVVKNENGDIWDANVGGILDRNISYYADRYKTVRRLNPDINCYYDIAWQNKIIDWINIKQKICQGYDYLAWLGFGTGIEYFEDEDRWYCSELPYWMFQDNGLKLTGEDLTFVYPNFFLYDKRWVRPDLFQSILWEEVR